MTFEALPGNGKEVGYPKTIDCDLASGGDLFFTSSMMEIDVLSQVRLRELKSETCFGCLNAKLTARKVTLRLAESDFRNSNSNSCFHADTISPLRVYDYGKMNKQ